MKYSLFIIIFIVSACSHRPKLNVLSHDELMAVLMQQSLLTRALRSSILHAPNCLRPLETNMSQETYQRLTHLMRQHFSFLDMHRSIRQKMVAGTEAEKVRELAELLHDSTWRNFLQGTQAVNTMSEKYTNLFHNLETGTFDLQSRRVHLVAQVTDYALMLNLMRISNNQVLHMISEESKKYLSPKNEGLLNWVVSELQGLNEAHIKSLFVTNYLATENFSEAELEELIKIRSNSIFEIGRNALEQELQLRYNSFYLEMKGAIALGKDK